MANPVSCPSCEARFKVGDQSRGRKIKCPKCGSAITVGAGAEKAGQPSRSARSREEQAVHSRKPARARREEYDEDDDEEEDRPRSRKPRKKGKSRAGLWIGLGVGVLLLAGGAAALVIYLTGGDGDGKNPPGTLAQGTDSSTGKQKVNPGDDSGMGGDDGNGNNPVIPPVVGPTLTSANLQKLKAGMTEKDVVAIFGPPRDQITGAEISQQVLGDPNFGDAYQDEINAYTNGGKLLAYLDNGAVLLIGLGNDRAGEPRQYGKILRAWLYSRQGDNLVAEVMELQGGRLQYSKKSTPYSG